MNGLHKIHKIDRGFMGGREPLINHWEFPSLTFLGEIRVKPPADYTIDKNRIGMFEEEYDDIW